MVINTEEELREKVINLLRDNVDDPSALDQLGLDDDLSALGINSLTFIKLVIATEMEFGVAWKDDDLDFRNFSSINAIMQYITTSSDE